MEIRSLRYFLTVVREENISHAAEILHITQPTLSRQMQELERELESKLFLRGKTKITLTDAGVLLRRRAEEMVALADKTKQEFLVKEELLSGVISIGCGESLAVQDLSKRIAEFSRQYPEVQFDIYTGTADHIKEQIEKGILDIGLLLEPIEIDKYEYVRLATKEYWGVLMRSDHPLAAKKELTKEELLSMPLILPRRIGSQNVIKSWFGDSYDKMNVVATSNMPANSVRLVMQGMGGSILIEGAVDMYKNPQLHFAFFNPPHYTTSVVVWKRYQPFGAATAKFMDFLKHTINA